MSWRIDPNHRTVHDIDKIQKVHTVQSEVASVLYDDSQHIKVHHSVQFQREESVIGVHVLDTIVLHATDEMENINLLMRVQEVV